MTDIGESLSAAGPEGEEGRLDLESGQFPFGGNMVTTFTIMGPEGEEGRLDWGSGRLTFSGNMAESARILFEDFLRPLVDSYLKEQAAEGIRLGKAANAGSGSVRRG